MKYVCEISECELISVEHNHHVFTDSNYEKGVYYSERELKDAIDVQEDVCSVLFYKNRGEVKKKYGVILVLLVITYVRQNVCLCVCLLVCMYVSIYIFSILATSFNSDISNFDIM